jgi:hypothetical protein
MYVRSLGVSDRSSRSVIDKPRLRNASSRSRFSRIFHENSSVSNTCGSGLNHWNVPVPSARPIFLSFCVVMPRSNRISYSAPSRLLRVIIHSESALTTEIPTPCRPPDTL